MELGLQHVPLVPQLFLLIRDDEVLLVVIKIVDDILACEPDPQLKWFYEEFGKKFNLGTVNHGTGKLRFFGLSITQFDDFSCTIDADDKLLSLDGYPIAIVRRRQVDEPHNII